MKNIEAREDFNPEKEVPSLEGKIIFITGGTAGIGRETVRTLAPHAPSHVYITGRNRKAADELIGEIQSKYPAIGMTFIEADFASLASVKEGMQKGFKHNKLDLLFCTAGVMTLPPGLKIQFAINHLAHGMVINCLLPTLLRTADAPGSDVRIITTSSTGYAGHPLSGISFSELDGHSTMWRLVFGPWIRYGQSKLAQILYASEIARRYPQITSVSLQPGVVSTDLIWGQPWRTRWFVHITCWLQGLKYMTPHQGSWNQTWCATVAKKEELTNGGFYYPVGVDYTEKLVRKGRDKELAKKLWDWTQEVLQKV